MFSNLLPDPTLLFRFKIDVHRLPRIQDVQDVTTWGLNDLHQLPPIGQFNCGAGPMEREALESHLGTQSMVIPSQHFGQQSL